MEHRHANLLLEILAAFRHARERASKNHDPARLKEAVAMAALRERNAVEHPEHVLAALRLLLHEDHRVRIGNLLHDLER